MKSFYKIITLALLMLGLFSVSGSVLAEETTPESISEKFQGGEMELVATVNIYGAKIISQDKNNFNISFVIYNGEIIQPGVKYGIQLIKETDKGQYLIDEKVYEEVLNMSQNMRITKKIDYVAPTNLDGIYKLYLISKNDKGMTFSNNFVGEVNLKSTISGLNILNETCYLKVSGEAENKKYNVIQGIDILETEDLNLHCIIENKSDKSISVTPNFETFYRSLYGNKVEQTGGDIGPISFNAGEKKEVSLTLPKATAPQAYDVRVVLSDGQIKSNSVIVHYVLRGPSATIQNLSLNKDYYKEGEEIQVSFLWSNSAHNFPSSRINNEEETPTYIKLDIVDKDNRECTNSLFSELSQNFNNPKVIILSKAKIDCLNPSVNASLTNKEGIILDQKLFLFETATKTPFELNTKSIIVIFVIILVFLFLLFKKREKNISNINPILFLIIFITLGLFVFVENASANNFALGDKSGAFWANVVVDWKQPTHGNYFLPTEDRPSEGSISISSCGNDITAQLYSEGVYLINNLITEKISYLSGAKTFPATFAKAGDYNQTFFANVVNSVTKQTIEGSTNLPYYIVGPGECCSDGSNYRGCCASNGGSTNDSQNEDYYFWDCVPTNYPDSSMYKPASCKLPKTLVKTSCNYDNRWAFLVNKVNETYSADWELARCNSGTPSAISITDDDGYGNKIVSYTCTGAGGDVAQCVVGIDPKLQCYSGDFKSLPSNYCDAKLCVDGYKNNCYYQESTKTFSWVCPTGDRFDGGLSHYCRYLVPEGPLVPELPNPECNLNNPETCIYGKPQNIRSTSTNYIWDCGPIEGETTSVVDKDCTVSKSSLVGDLTVEPHECLVDLLEDPSLGCNVNLSWLFSGPNASNVGGKVYLRNLTNGSMIAAKENMNGYIPSYFIAKDNTKIILTSTYINNSVCKYEMWFGDDNGDGELDKHCVYDEEIVRILKKTNLKPTPYVITLDGKETLSVMPNSIADFLIWAIDEDALPDNNDKDVTFQIDWNSDNTPDLYVPPKTGSDFTFVKSGDRITFSNIDVKDDTKYWWGEKGTHCFQYRALDYYDQVNASAWKSFCVKILDPNTPTGTLTAEPNPCSITIDGGSTCETKLTATVTNPVTGAQTNVTKNPLSTIVFSDFTYTTPKTALVEVKYPSTTFFLNHDSITLNDLPVGAKCGKTATDEQLVEDPITKAKCIKQVPVSKPDLEPYNIQLSSGDINDIKENNYYSFLATVRNNNPVSFSTDFDNTFQITQTKDNPSSWNVYKQGSKWIYGGLAAKGEINDKKEIEASVFFPNDGTWYLRICADTDGGPLKILEGLVDESSETNNCTYPLTINVKDNPIPPTDTNEWTVDIKAGPYPVFDGRQGKVEWKITKTGTGGKCTVSSDDSSFPFESYTESTSGYISYTHIYNLVFPEKTHVYHYKIKCDDIPGTPSIPPNINGTTEATITVIKTTEIEN